MKSQGSRKIQGGDERFLNVRVWLKVVDCPAPCLLLPQSSARAFLSNEYFFALNSFSLPPSFPRFS